MIHPAHNRKNRARASGTRQGKGRRAMATVDTTPELIADLGDEVKSRSANAAAAKLEGYGGAAIAMALSRLSPAFAQDVLDALPSEARERTLGAASGELARQWQVNARFAKD